MLWASADNPRAQMDAAEYKHLVLGLIFLTYISDRFVEQRQNVLAMVSNPDRSTTWGRPGRAPEGVGSGTTPGRTCSGCLPLPAGNR